MGRLKTLSNLNTEEVRKGKQTTLQENMLESYTSTYDIVGNIISNGEENYTYDEIARLTNVNIPDMLLKNDRKNIEVNTSYLYDSVGNRESMEQTTTWETKRGKDKERTKIADYSVNTLNQYTNLESFIEKDDRDPKRNKVKTFTYDTNGNLKSDGNFEYFYDYKNRLVEVKRGEKKEERSKGKDDRDEREHGDIQESVAHYSYDTLGRRLEKKSGNVTVIPNYINYR